MDEINKIRKAFFTENKSKHAVTVHFNRSWETINRIVSSSREDLAIKGKRPNRKPRVLTPEVEEFIESLLDEEVIKKVKRKLYSDNYIYLLYGYLFSRHEDTPVISSLQD